MTEMQTPMWRDAYLFEAPARVLAVTEEGRVVLDRPIFYPAGGGQPGDVGEIEVGGRTIAVADAVKAGGPETCALVLAEGETPPGAGR